MPRVVLRLRADAIHVSGDPLGRQERRLSDADWRLFDGWVAAYRAAGTKPEALLELGEAIHAWLDGPERWIATLRRAGGGAAVAEFAVDTHADEHQRVFLAVPWELLADGGRLLAADEGVQWAPVRRIGPERETPQARTDHRLGLMFMAASPEGERQLESEREEASILKATQHAGLDLFVEELGNLDDLGIGWSDLGNLDALHLSCHGAGGAEPFLALETEAGTVDEVHLRRLVAAFPGGSIPRLLFLSACHTGEDMPDVDSLSRRLVAAGFPAVLGWADSVYDSDASAFAAAFYGVLARRGATVEEAWATARFALLNRGAGKTPRHWHLARLLLGPAGGGVLSRGKAPRRRNDVDQGRKRFLDSRQQKIEVASRFEFVGRRRELQRVLREFRDAEHAGVLIHGFGRQGKSSLAARIVDRVGQKLEPVVLYQRCDAIGVLKAIRDALAGVPEVTRICDDFASQVDADGKGGDSTRVYDALRALFDGPCGYVGRGRPILLVLDDFEALLDAPRNGGDWLVKDTVVAPLAAVIRAFDQGGTDSRLLITSRYTFPLSADGRDLAARLLAIPLPQMSEAAALKQARQKAFASYGAGADKKLTDNRDLTSRAMKAARGNAGLQDILFRAVMTDRQAGQAAVESLEAFLAGGQLPAAGELRATLEKLAVDSLIASISDGERELLRASTIATVPFPIDVWRGFAADAGYGAPDRLIAFGLWERLPDIVDGTREAVVRNAIAGERIGRVPEDASKLVAGAIVPRLYEAWGGIALARRSRPASLQLALLAMLGDNPDVLEASAVDGVRALEAIDAYRQAGNFATNCIAALSHAGRNPSPDLLRAAVEMYTHVGDVDALRLVWAVAKKIGAMQDDDRLSADNRGARAGLRLRYSNYMVRQGNPDEGLHEAEAALTAFEAIGDQRLRAIALGDIARIRRDKGDVDAALALHEEELRVYEALGDRRSRAIALGDIARIRKNKGDVDAALALHEEQVLILEALGDRVARAIALGDIARIRGSKGDGDAALALHEERAQILESLGDRRAHAIALGDIARIKTDRGDVDAALALHEGQVQIFEALGDRRLHAIALGDIARIKAHSGDVDVALALHNQELAIYEAVGDRRSRAITLGDIGRIKAEMGDVDAALALHEERRQIFEALGDLRERAIALGDVANIVVRRGDIARFFAIKADEIETYTALGDRRSLSVTYMETGQFHLQRALEEQNEESFALAVKELSEAYRIAMDLRDAGVVANVGVSLSIALAAAGNPVEAQQLLERSRTLFLQLGQQQSAARVDALLRRFSGAAGG